MNKNKRKLYAELSISGSTKIEISVAKRSGAVAAYEFVWQIRCKKKLYSKAVRSSNTTQIIKKKLLFTQHIC